MELGGNVVLITGGASGIGLALAKRFARAGSEVIVCGRREDALTKAQSEVAGLHTRVCDVSSPEERVALFKWATNTFSQLNVLVNNAGVQRRLSLLESEAWEQTHQELAINLDAPIHLCQLFAPFLLQQKKPSIINVTSGLAFAPLANVPVYCATKAALHSFTLSLRHQLRQTPIAVAEIIPPAVNTDLGGPGLHTFGAPLDDFADAVMQRLAQGELEVAYGTAEQRSRASREELDEYFTQMNQRFA